MLRNSLNCLKIIWATTSTLGPASIEMSVRLFRDVLKYSFRGKSEEEANGSALLTMLSSLGAEDSYLNRGGGTLSATYKGKILITCIRAIGVLVDKRTPPISAVDQEITNTTLASLKNLQRKFAREEKRERAASREREKKRGEYFV